MTGIANLTIETARKLLSPETISAAKDVVSTIRNSVASNTDLATAAKEYFGNKSGAGVEKVKQLNSLIRKVKSLMSNRKGGLIAMGSLGSLLASSDNIYALNRLIKVLESGKPLNGEITEKALDLLQQVSDLEITDVAQAFQPKKKIKQPEQSSEPQIIQPALTQETEATQPVQKTETEIQPQELSDPQRANELAELAKTDPVQAAKKFMENLGGDGKKLESKDILKRVVEAFGAGKVYEKILDSNEALKELGIDLGPKPTESSEEVKRLREEINAHKTAKEEAEEKLKSQESPNTKLEDKLTTEAGAKDVLRDKISTVIEREVKNKASIFGLAASAASALKSAGGSEGLANALSNVANPDEYLKKNVLTDQFMDAISKSIKGENRETIDGIVNGLNEFQKKAFKITDWSVWAVNKLPMSVIDYFPLATNVMKWMLPVARFIPVVGPAIGTIYPVLDEVAGFVGKFNIEADAIQKASKVIRGEKLEESDKKSDETRKEEPAADAKNATPPAEENSGKNKAAAPAAAPSNPAPEASPAQASTETVTVVPIAGRIEPEEQAKDQKDKDSNTLTKNAVRGVPGKAAA